MESFYSRVGVGVGEYNISILYMSSSNNSSPKSSKSNIGNISSKSPMLDATFVHPDEDLVRSVDELLDIELEMASVDWANEADIPNIKQRITEIRVDYGADPEQTSFFRELGDGNLYFEYRTSFVLEVPFSVNQFPNLNTLRVYFNHLKYEFDYSQMPQLRELNISGSESLLITKNISLLKNLETLELINNDITSLPEGITELKKLHTLNLYSNKLTTLPAEIANLKNLQTLNLSINKITTLPAEMANMRKLTMVNLDKNELTTFPEGLGNPSIKHLILNRTHIDTFPLDVLRKMKGLETLSFGFMYPTYHTNPLVPLCELKSLKNLNMSFIDWILEIPAEIGNLKNLVTFHLYGSKKLSSIHDNIGKLVNLEELGISGSSISSLPKGIGKLKNLKRLDISNMFTIPDNKKLQNLPDVFDNLDNIEKIVLAGAILNEASMRHLSKMRNLKQMILIECGIRDLSDEFCNLVNLEELNLMDNQIEELPENIGNLKKLKTINLQDCLLTLLPDSFIHLSNLENLYIDGNILTDLPVGFENLHNLRCLHIHKNRLGNRINSLLTGLINRENRSIRIINVTSNGTRFRRDVVDRILEFEDEEEGGSVEYEDRPGADNANIIPHIPVQALAAPAQEAMEVHREFDLMDKTELVSVLGGLQIFPENRRHVENSDPASFNSMLYSRIESYLLYFKDHDKAEYDRIMGYLATIKNKMNYANFTDNKSTLNLFYTVLQYVEKQPKLFKAFYAYNYVLSNALAYCNQGDTTSCTLGIKERILMDLASGLVGLPEKDIKPEYIEIARIIQQDKIPAEWTNIDNLQIKQEKIVNFTNACINSRQHQTKMRLLHTIGNNKEEYKKLKTAEEQIAFKLNLRKKYLTNCITKKIVGSFSSEADRIRFKNAEAPIVVKNFVNSTFIEEMLEDDAFHPLSHGGRKMRGRKTRDRKTRKLPRRKQRKTRRM